MNSSCKSEWCKLGNLWMYLCVKYWFWFKCDLCEVRSRCSAKQAIPSILDFVGFSPFFGRFNIYITFIWNFFRKLISHNNKKTDDSILTTLGHKNILFKLPTFRLIHLNSLKYLCFLILCILRCFVVMVSAWKLLFFTK